MPVKIYGGLLCPSFTSVKLVNNTRPSLLVHKVEVHATPNTCSERSVVPVVVHQDIGRVGRSYCKKLRDPVVKLAAARKLCIETRVIKPSHATSQTFAGDAGPPAPGARFEASAGRFYRRSAQTVSGLTLARETRFISAHSGRSHPSQKGRFDWAIVPPS